MYARLNLATKPLLSHRRFYLGSAFFGLLAGVLCLWLALRFHDVRKADASFRVREDKLQTEMNGLIKQRDDLDAFFNRSENRNLQDRAKFIDAIIEADSFNWTKMFMDLERTLPAGVRVVRVEPRLEHGAVSVKFLAGASSEIAKDQVVKAFEDSRSFTHFVLYSVGPTRPGAPDAIALEFSVIYTGI